MTVVNEGTKAVISVVTKSSDYTVKDREVVLADASGGAFTITLGDPTNSDKFNIKKTDSSPNDVTIATPNNETIDGQSNIVLSTQYTSRTIVCDGSDYFII